MTEGGKIKRLVLKVLLACDGVPMGGEILDGVIKTQLVPRPLASDIEIARNDLESGGYIIGTRDDVDGGVTWALTTKGILKAKQV